MLFRSGFYLNRPTQAVALLDRIGYDGWVGCEYKPATTTEAGLGWLQTFAA